MSIRLRLTLYYVILLAVILAVFSGGLYAIVTFQSLNEVDRTLQTRAAEVENGARTALALQSEPALSFSRGGVRFLPAADVFVTPGVFVQVNRLDGSPITRSDNLGDQTLVLAPDALSRVVNNGDSFYTNVTVENAPLRAYVAPLRFRSQTIGVIEVAQSLQPVYDTTRRLATLLGGGIILSLALAFLIGALLARNALMPIDRVTQTAHSITHAGDLTRRLEPPKTQDEVGRLAATFNEMLGRIEELFRAQQRFVSDVSHELRSPLTAIRGNIDLLRRGGADNVDERQQMFAAIDSETERMKRLVDDLLLLARADEGFKFQTQLVELDTILLDVYRQARVMANGGVKVLIGNEDQAQVMGDPDRLKQLFLNLMDNAIKYTPNDGEVTLSLERDSQWVRVSVADTGVGIPPEDLPRIFDRFYRVDKSRTRESSNGKGGTGLGLAIAKWVTEAHGGRIEVFSELSKGTTFTVWLPVARQGNGSTPAPSLN